MIRVIFFEYYCRALVYFLRNAVRNKFLAKHIIEKITIYSRIYMFGVKIQLKLLFV